MFVNLDIPAMTTKARLLSDKRGSDFVNDKEVQSLLQDSFDTLFNELVETQENYFLKDSGILKTTPTAEDANIVNEIVLPSDLYKIRMVERVEGQNSYPVYEKTLHEVSTFYKDNSSWFYGPENIRNIAYVLFSDRIKLYPEHSVGGDEFKIFYVRDPKTITEEKMQNSWERYIEYKTAYKITVIEQNQNESLLAEASKLASQIKVIASQRSTGPRTVQELDVLANHRI